MRGKFMFLGPQSLWGQTTWNLSCLSPKRDCGPKVVEPTTPPHIRFVCPINQGLSRVVAPTRGLGQEVFEFSRVGRGRAGSSRARRCEKVSRIGSDHPYPTRPHSTRPDPT